MKENTSRIGDGHDRSGKESFPCRWPEINYNVSPEKLKNCGKVDSAFYPSEVGEMNSSSIINATQACRGCADPQRSPRWTPSARAQVHTAGAGMCRRVGL